MRACRKNGGWMKLEIRKYIEKGHWFLVLVLLLVFVPQRTYAEGTAIGSLVSEFVSTSEKVGNETSAMIYARNKKYGSSSWNFLGGKLTDEQTKILNGSVLNQYNTIQVNGQAFDVPHFFAALNVYAYSGGNPYIAPCIDMCGWAGDLAAYVGEVNEKKFLAANSAFSMEDWTADLDAWNIYKEVKQTGNTYAREMKQYFQKVTEKSRIELFMKKISSLPFCKMTKETFCNDLKTEFLKQYRYYQTVSQSLKMDIGIPKNLADADIEKACQNMVTYIWNTMREEFRKNEFLHVIVIDKAIDATCEKDGKTEGQYCSECNKVLKKATVVKTKRHSWDSGKITLPSTYTKTGIKLYTCDVCGASKTEEVPKKKLKTGTKTPDDNGKAQYIVTDLTKKEVSYVTPVNAKLKNIVIPNSVKIAGKTFKVVKIANSAFKGNKTVTKVTFGNNIKSVGNHAFYGAVNLESVTLNQNLTEIGSSAFRGCISLQSLLFPAKTTKIGINAFYGDKKLKVLQFTATSLSAKTLAAKSLNGLTKTTTVKVPKKKLKTYKNLFLEKGLSVKVKIVEY